MSIFRRCTKLKYIIIGVLCMIFYSEWLVYWVQPYFWDTLDCPDEDKSCTKIVFISDPQIQGDNEVPPPLSYIFNWDIDHYLSSTFPVVLHHFKPHILIYMGDLFDEGSQATLEQFHKYVKRLLNIFTVDYPVVQIWLPGDNDIGGEGEPIRRERLLDFDTVFQQPSVIVHKNVTIYKVNAITHHYPRRVKEGSLNFRIVVSHYPIISRPMFAKQVHKEIEPHIYFCAHDHQSAYSKHNNDFKFEGKSSLTYGDSPLNITFNNNVVYEIYTPTCSYRMGTDKIGFGAAILDNNNQNLRYTVFWSPRRFPVLFIYLCILISLILYSLVFCLVKLLHSADSATYTRLITKP